MSFARVIVPEVLDGLAANDPQAQRSRRDLQRVHRVMGTRGTVLRALRALPIRRSSTRPLQVLELGAGDGSLMLGVARTLQFEWPAVALTLLDLQNLLTPSLSADYAAVGWHAGAQVCDALAWAEGADVDCLPRAAPRWDLIVVNLFLHHFQTPQLTLLLAAIAARSEHFFACEPRRGGLPLAASHLIGALGVNAVTREDAVLSVRAGFRGNELTAMWPANAPGSSTQWLPKWTLREYSAGLFSHCLMGSQAMGTQPDIR